jgi:ribosome-binding factor A
MSEFRMKRVNELVRRELSDLIRQHLPVNDYGVVSVTDVRVSKDLKAATVFISTIGQPVGATVPGTIEALEKIRAPLQHELSRRVVMKYTPQLLFKVDASIERGQNVVRILEELEAESPAGNGEDEDFEEGGQKA